MTEERQYKNKVVFGRKSKAGKHIYAFNRDNILGGDVGSLLFNIPELEQLLASKVEYIKVSVLPPKEE